MRAEDRGHWANSNEDVSDDGRARCMANALQSVRFREAIHMLIIFPYSEYYGRHPTTFDFNAIGRMLPSESAT